MSYCSPIYVKKVGACINRPERHVPSGVGSPKEQYHEYLSSDYWKAVVAEAKKRDNHRCVVCNSEKEIHVHHRTYEHRGAELDFLSDVTCLCKSCHYTFHRKIGEPGRN